METVIYLCAQCEKPLDGDSLESHVCWPNVLVEPVFKGEREAELEETMVYNEEEDLAAVAEISGGQDGSRKKLSIKGRRGEWTDEDVHRLIAIYVKNYKQLPKQDGLHNHYFWDRVMKDLKPYGNFSRFLVQTKIKKLKNAYQMLQNYETSTKWPFFEEMSELIRVENDPTIIANTADTEHSGDNTDDDSVAANTEVHGLRRWKVKETRHLLNIYKKHLPGMALNGSRRKFPWSAIVADLEYDLPKRFSMIQIRTRIRNVLNTYRDIVAHKRKKQMTHWPLFKDVVEVFQKEQELFSNFDGVPLACEEFIPSDEPEIEERAHWNVEETQELIAAYLNHISELNSQLTEDESRKIWEEITDDVNAIRRRKVTAVSAQSKIRMLRTLFANQDEKSLGPLFDQVQIMVDTENLYSASNQKCIQTQRKPKRSAQIVTRNEAPKRRREETMPSWYIKYAQDMQRRHKEKIAIHRSMIEVLEKLFTSQQ